MDLRSIIYWMEQNDGLLLKSAFGTNPMVMKQFLDLMGIPCDLYTDLSAFEAKKANGNIYIVCQWNNKDTIMDAAHFYAVECYNGKLYSFNGYHDCRSATTDPNTNYYTRDYGRGGTNTFSELMNHGSKIGSLICGFVLHK